MSELTVGTMTVTTLDLQNSTVTVKGSVLQTIVSSTTVIYTTSSSTPIAVPGLTATITPTGPATYIRISVSGILSSQVFSLVGPLVNLSIQRDSTILEGRPLISTNNIQPAGATIIDRPGDINTHVYRVLIDNGGGGLNVSFPATSTAFFVLEEIAN